MWMVKLSKSSMTSRILRPCEFVEARESRTVASSASSFSAASVTMARMPDLPASSSRPTDLPTPTGPLSTTGATSVWKCVAIFCQTSWLPSMASRLGGAAGAFVAFDGPGCSLLGAAGGACGSAAGGASGSAAGAFFSFAVSSGAAAAFFAPLPKRKILGARPPGTAENSYADFFWPRTFLFFSLRAPSKKT